MEKKEQNKITETDDLKEIKKLYGEEFMRLCRKLFPTILEQKGKLIKILTESFEPNKTLAKDIKEQERIEDFANFVFKKFEKKTAALTESNENPFELMKKKGYTLYWCKNNIDVQSFKKYYYPDRIETLCTFRDPTRIEKNYIFFAVKDNVDEIKREQYYETKERQDPYGTSVISLQFSKPNSYDAEKTSFLSIKNRWNHKVLNPDATFSNDLEKICVGLTNSFEKHLNIKISTYSKDFELIGYISDINGKYYRYNNEINAKYYCGNNTIISNGEAVRINPDKYLLVDYFLIDKQNGKVWDITKSKNDKDFPESLSKNYQANVDKDLDSFSDSLGNIQKIEVEKYKDEKLGCDKVIKVTTPEGQAKIYINKNNSMVKYDNPYVKEIGDYFCAWTSNLQYINLPANKKIGSNFCDEVDNLVRVNLPNNEEIGDWFCGSCETIQEINLPKNKKIGNFFCYQAYDLKDIDLPNNEVIGDWFCSNVEYLEEVILPKNEVIGDLFCSEVYKLKKVELPNNKKIGNKCCILAANLQEFKAPKNKIFGRDFCACAEELKIVDLSSNENESIESNCFRKSIYMKSLTTSNDLLEKFISKIAPLCKITKPDEWV